MARRRHARLLRSIIVSSAAAFLGIGTTLVAPGAHPASAAAVCTPGTTTVTCVFDYTGAAQNWVAPPGVTSVRAEVFGAQGGDFGSPIFGYTSFGGRGGWSAADLSVTTSETLIVMVGGRGGNVDWCQNQASGGAGGFNGGGRGAGDTGTGLDNVCDAAGGGGGTDIRTSAGSLTDRLLIAGGGGGAAATEEAHGGHGGGPIGTYGSIDAHAPASVPGAPGEQSGIPARFGQGQDGTLTPAAWLATNMYYGGGGGGGGYYGGSSHNVGLWRGSGGGGSGYALPARATNYTWLTGARSGDGLASITYPRVGIAIAVDSVAEASISLNVAVAPNGRADFPIRLTWWDEADPTQVFTINAAVTGSSAVTLPLEATGLTGDTGYVFQATVPGDEWSASSAVTQRTAAAGTGDGGGTGDDGGTGDGGGTGDDGTGDGGGGTGDDDGAGDDGDTSSGNGNSGAVGDTNDTSAGEGTRGSKTTSAGAAPRAQLSVTGTAGSGEALIAACLLTAGLGILYYSRIIRRRSLSQ